MAGGTYGWKGDQVMMGNDRIEVNPEILTGKPVVKGTRLAVEFVLDLLAQGWSEGEVLRNYPGLTHEDVLACLSYASAILHAEKVYPVPVSE
jgi:uncharacterized protein (DUF433 family)